MRTLEFIHKDKQTIDRNQGQSMRSIAKNIVCIWKDNQKECSWRHSIQTLRDKEMTINLFLKKSKENRLNGFKILLNQLKNPTIAKIDGC